MVEGCTGCEFMPYCRRFMKEKVGTEKIFEINPRFVKLKQKARDLLLSPRGIEVRVNRSCQVEGAFDNMKQNLAYSRCRRTSIERVATEIALTCLGINIRKYMRFALNKTLLKFWIAPANLEPGVFKKPSAKRLANRANKKLARQANDVVRDKYKYKKRER